MQAKRAAQAAALFLLKAGGTMPRVKLMKLLYLADRESYRVHGAPITRDRMVSTPQGPVLSGVYDLMTGKRAAADWLAYVGPLRDKTLELAPGVTEETPMGSLSKANRSVIDDVWRRLGGAGSKEIAKATHAFGEWEDPRGSSKPIERYALLTKGLGMASEEVQALVEEEEDEDRLDADYDEWLQEQAAQGTQVARA